MHLKTLTLRGFKSFASSTTLQLEPGITAVVGPNGSGKSNVVDALAWVMGEQGAKSLRGGAMSDVIFAGTPGRPALGRAEVVLTIDNSDRALPTDAAEVTISRTLFRNGTSEYAINSQPCRLLDVTELLADSGIGREMHVIVGQGQLDQVLHATPEVRRGLVEEAAGVLKHRKRKEKALRKLDATAANMARLADLTTELRRQLTPLARQAEAARRAATVQAEVRDARLRLLADDLVRLDAELTRDQTLRTDLLARRDALEADIAALTRAIDELDSAERAHSAEVSSQVALVTELTALRERVDGTLALAAERAGRLGQAPDGEHGPDPDDVDAEAGETEHEVAALTEVVDQAQHAVRRAVARREAAESEHAAAQRLADDRRAEQERRREAAARLTTQLEAGRSRLAASRDELDRLLRAQHEAADRAARARTAFQSLESSVGGLSDGEEELDAEHTAAETALLDVERLLVEVEQQENRAERERAAAQSRIDTLTRALGRPDATGTLLADPDTARLLRGSVAAALSIDAGAETAVAAALGDLADAAVAGSVDDAAGLLAGAAAAQLGRAVLLVGGTSTDEARRVPAHSSWPALPTGIHYLVSTVVAPHGLHSALQAAIGPMVHVADVAQARAVVDEVDGVGAVTTDGTVLSRHVAIGGPAGGSRVELQADLDQANAELESAQVALDQARFARSRHQAARQEHADRLDAALAALHESDAELAAVAERLAQLGHDMRAAEAEADRLAGAAQTVAERLDAESTAVTDLESAARQAAAALEAASVVQPDLLAPSLDDLAEQSAAARQAEVAARLELRTGEERLRTASTRAGQLRDRAHRLRAEREAARRRYERDQRRAAVASWVAAHGQVLAQQVERALNRARAEREAFETANAGRLAERRRLGAEVTDRRRELDTVVETLHADEVALAELRLKVDATRQRARDEWGVEPGPLVDEYGPHVLIPSTSDDEPPVPYDREAQQQRAEKAERALARLGRINPLALEEHAAAEERLRYLTGQVDDLQSTRRDLLAIVREVDDRVETVFAEAFADTAREFEGVFGRLFPGGEGRLVLTDPENLLTTGIEVEARPPGKRIKRLSLLSGGERSLVAVAFLVALFRARPSPFYVLDEVEAALDDVNLGRLLDLYEELRETSQLVVITHQKRTMEIADALYGVSMRADGVSAVISQRLREAETV